MASAVRSVSWHWATPERHGDHFGRDLPFSLSRTASSIPISSNGFIDILTLASSTPDLSAFTRILTL